MHQIELPHQITYQTVSNVDVRIVAKSLVANATLLEDAVSLLSGLVPGMEMQITQVRVKDLSNNSPLKEVLALAIFMSFQDDLQTGVPKLVEHVLNIHVSEEYATVVTVAVMLLAIYSIDQAMQRFFPGKDSRQLKADYEDKLGRLAEISGIPSQEVHALVESRQERSLQKKIIQASLDFIFPAKQDSGVAITSCGDLMISAESVRQVPTELDYLLEENARTYNLAGVRVDIHRADRDTGNAGWRGIVKEVSQKKIKLALSPEISAEDLFTKKTITADIVVVEEKKASGDFKPKAIHVMRIID